MTIAPTFTEVTATLHLACRALAGVCDHAASQDDMGFNGGDANFGHSMGQKDSVNAYYFHGANTIDQDVWEVLQDKWQVVTEILNGDIAKDNSVLNTLMEKFRS